MMSLLNNEILDKIVQQISELYVRNTNPSEFIRQYHGKIPLQHFMCFTYGCRSGKPGRVIEVIYFLAKSHCSNQNPYKVALYNRDTCNYTTIWIENTCVLRKDFLKFTKKTHLFRNTFLYDPQSTNIYRLHELKPYLHLPYKSVLNETIWISDKIHYESTTCNVDECATQDTAIVPVMTKYKQIVELSLEMNRLIYACK